MERPPATGLQLAVEFGRYIGYEISPEVCGNVCTRGARRAAVVPPISHPALGTGDRAGQEIRRAHPV